MDEKELMEKYREGVARAIGIPPDEITDYIPSKWAKKMSEYLENPEPTLLRNLMSEIELALRYAVKYEQTHKTEYLERLEKKAERIKNITTALRRVVK